MDYESNHKYKLILINKDLWALHFLFNSTHGSSSSAWAISAVQFLSARVQRKKRPQCDGIMIHEKHYLIYG